MSLGGSRPQALLRQRKGHRDRVSLPQSCHLVGKTLFGTWIPNVEGIPGESAPTSWWGILKHQKYPDRSPTDEDHGPVLHLGNIEHACVLPLLPTYCGPNDSQQLLLRGPCPQVVPQ